MTVAKQHQIRSSHTLLFLPLSIRQTGENNYDIHDLIMRLVPGCHGGQLVLHNFDLKIQVLKA